MTKTNGETPPGFYLYTQDYFGDALVRLMPPDKRLVWVEMFFLMSESPKRGVLLKKNGQPYTAAELAPICNCAVDLVEATMRHVVAEEIASVDRNTGAILNRRMVRDEIKRKACEKAGRKGWKAKQAKHSNPNQLPLTLEPASSPSPSPAPFPTPSPVPKEEETHAPSAASVSPVPVVPEPPPKPPKEVKYSPDFEEFWSSYPKQRKKGDAWKAWRSTSHPPVAEILAKLGQARESEDWNRERGRFIPLPATWIRAHGWHDNYNVKLGGPAKPRAGLKELEAIAARDFGPLRKTRQR